MTCFSYKCTNEISQVHFCPIIMSKLLITTALESEVFIRYIVKHQDKMYSMPHLSYLIDGETIWKFDIDFNQILKLHVVTASKQFPDNCVFS